MLRLASSLAEDVVELRSHQFGLQYQCLATPAQPSAQVQDEPTPMTGDIQLSVEEFVEQPILQFHLDIPTSSRKYKRTGRWIVKMPSICKSPFVAQCLKLFLKISHKDRLIVDFALDEDANPRKEEILDKSCMFLQANIVGHDVVSYEMLFLPICENNHWHLHVLNIPAGCIEILSSLPLQRGNYISASTRRLSMDLERALHAHGIHVNVEVSKLVHVQPDLVQQKNGYDCGIFALKYMEYWNGATLTQAIVEVANGCDIAP
ncbi:hypothetical protein AAG906_005855 [Vitis piasezkii]